jgi:hypothetical protein
MTAMGTTVLMGQLRKIIIILIYTGLISARAVFPLVGAVLPEIIRREVSAFWFLGVKITKMGALEISVTRTARRSTGLPSAPTKQTQPPTHIDSIELLLQLVPRRPQTHVLMADFVHLLPMIKTADGATMPATYAALRLPAVASSEEKPSLTL